MKERSRTEYSFLNTTIITLSKMMILVMGYLTRIVFTRMLDQNYVGISGLFLELFKVLSLSELGIGTAITFALYKPVVENDIEKQKSLMTLYKRLYQIVACVIAIFGVIIYFFLDVLIKGHPEVKHLELIYFLYLINAIFSYMFAYKKTLIDVHQCMYISALYYAVSMIIQYTVQMVVLLTTKNFILYLVVYLSCTLGNNYFISRKAEKLYPYLKEKEFIALEKSEKRDIAQKIKAVFMHKAGTIILKNTDTLLLSSMIGIISVSCYTNYNLLIGSVIQVLEQLFRGLASSVGNLGVEENKEYLQKVFETIFFAGCWISGFFAICLFEILNPFIELSFGANYLLQNKVVLLLCINFYLTGIRQVSLIFHDSLGLFWYDRYKAIIEAGVNLVFSVLLAKRMGIVGIFLGTLISIISVSLWVDPYILYKYKIKRPLKEYFKRAFAYMFVLTVTGIFVHIICSRITGTVLYQVLIRLIVCLVVPNTMFWICFHNIEEYKFFMKKLKKLIMSKE